MTPKEYFSYMCDLVKTLSNILDVNNVKEAVITALNWM